MEEKISAGSRFLDAFLEGGYEKEVMSMIYGPAGSGKTTTCLLAAAEMAKNKKVIFIDTEGGFSVNRLMQIAPKKVLDNLLVLKPTNFEEQKETIEKLNKHITDKVGLIIVDTVSSLYREEVAKDEFFQEANRELSKQLAFLVEIARKKQIPVLISNQVYSNFDDRTKINLVGGDVVKYRPKCSIELQSLAGNKRRIILRKHRHLPEKEAFFEIKSEGFFEIKKGFKLF